MEGWATQSQKNETSLNVCTSNKAEVEDIKFSIVQKHRSLPFGKGDGGMGFFISNTYLARLEIRNQFHRHVSKDEKQFLKWCVHSCASGVAIPSLHN